MSAMMKILPTAFGHALSKPHLHRPIASTKPEDRHVDHRRWGEERNGEKKKKKGKEKKRNWERLILGWFEYN